MNHFSKRCCAAALLSYLYFCSSLSSRGETNPKYYAVEVSAVVQAAPPQITLKWAADANASSYTIYRKAPEAASWTQITSVAGNATTWTDVGVANGKSYEYFLQKTTTTGYPGTGFILAGINAPMIENRGKVILIVDNTFASALSSELSRLQQDLVGDGWTVLRHDVSRNNSVVTVKNLIKADYNADPSGVKSVFLFGHVPVPYSGNLNPDGHPDHVGAWPSDAYYGDMNGTWTDTSVNNSSASKPWNWNVPGDGKFDQTELPSDLELQVGRVDLYNMTCFANKTPSRSELDLLRAYLEKDHKFRSGQLVVPRRGLICDNFGERNGEAFASSGWRNFAPFFGAENDVQTPYGTFFTTLKNNAYLWSYGTGGGSWYTCDGVGSSDDFATTDIQTVFTAFLGSYFGDWDNESAFLRAPLGSGVCLATAWAGRPHGFFHHMGLGETIGHSALLSQNNRGLYTPQNYGTHWVHTALLGDPTLRLHPVVPPSNLSAGLASGVTLNWSASTDSNIQGYSVYRGSSVNGPFTKISGSGLVNTLGFVDATGTAGSVYMVRAVKLEQSGSGTYYNPSQGVIASIGGAGQPSAPAAPSALKATVISSSQINLQWTDNSTNESGFKLLRKAGAGGTYTAVNISANTKTWSDTGLTPETQYYYKICAWNATGPSVYSVEISASTPSAPSTFVPAAAVFLADDFITGGAWKGGYGGEGQIIVGDSSNVSAGAVFNGGTDHQGWTWADPAADAGSLQHAATPDRIASCFFSATEMNLNLRFADTNISQLHRVALYFLDWDKQGRSQSVYIYDADTGALINSKDESGFGGGVYQVWNFRGNVRIRIIRRAGSNCVLSGIFFGSSASTPGTTGGSTGATGGTDSGTAVRALGANNSTQGSWKGVFGGQGYQIMEEGSSLPAVATVTPSGKSGYVWSWNSSAVQALQKTSAPDRLAACWYADNAFDVKVSITDGGTHKITFYCLDWDTANRTQKIEVLNAGTGSLLSTANVSNFQNGTYVSWDVKGSVIFRFTRTGPMNAVVSGMFIDAPGAAL